MKKIVLMLTCLTVLAFNASSQGYDIKVTIKGGKDTMAYLVKYIWDMKSIADTCKKVKNGVIEFKGDKPLDKGMYVVVSQDKVIYFDLFIDDSQKMTFNSEMPDIYKNIKVSGSKENEQFFEYTKYMSSKNGDFVKYRDQTKGKSKEDSTKFMNEKIKLINDEVKKFEADFMQKVKGTYVYDVMNLKTEKEAPEIPKAKNGRPDSLYAYYYYKNHYFDGVNFKDERIVRNPFFEPRIKKYFDNVIVSHPDSAIVEVDRILDKCELNSDLYDILLRYFTYRYEQSKIMGFDKVFVHIAEKYIISGKSDAYSAETVTKIKERVDIMKNLLLDAKVSDIYMIDTTDGAKVRKMGFDTTSTSKSVTDLYYKNVDKLTPMFKTLYSVNAKYTILVFWAADCGHCQKEIPKLNEDLKEIKGKIDFKVFAVETKDELYDSWKKFIIEKKLDFINVYDPIHLNNLKERFDIYSTPVIYILDKDKKIKAKRLGSEQVVQYLKTLENVEKENQKKNEAR